MPGGGADSLQIQPGTAELQSERGPPSVGSLCGPPEVHVWGLEPSEVHATICAQEVVIRGCLHAWQQVWGTGVLRCIHM